jgi:hypothetical protein
MTRHGPMMSSFDEQIGGDHYQTYTVQPVEFLYKNNVPFIEGNIIKYVLRHKNKNGVEDLKKARHYVDMLIELEGSNVGI